MTRTLEPIITSPKCSLGEGPVWYDGLLYWVDINAGAIWHRCADGAAQQLYKASDTVGCIIPRMNGGWVAGVGSELIFLDVNWNEEHRLRLPIDRDTVRINDGKADPAGRLFIGTMARDASDGKGALFRIDADMNIKEIISNTGISNGLDWSEDERTFYFVDSLRQSIFTYSYDIATGSITNGTLLARIDERVGTPDGMTLDANGTLWVALWGGSGVACVNVVTGEVGEVVQAPAPHITCCTIAESGVLCATSASCALPETDSTDFPHAGQLFSIAIEGLKPARLTSTFLG